MKPSVFRSVGPRVESAPGGAVGGVDLSVGEVERLLQLARPAEADGGPAAAPCSERERSLMGLLAPDLARSAAADLVWAALRQVAAPGDRAPRTGALAFDLEGTLLSACSSARRLC